MTPFPFRPKEGKPIRLRVLDARDAQLRLVRLSARNTADDCWHWLAYCDKGYARIKWHGRSVWAHRLSYAAYNGPIAAYETIHHKCGNPSCVNPAHLEALPLTAHNNDF